MNIMNQNKVLLDRHVKTVRSLGDIILTAMRHPMLLGDQDVIQLQFDNYSKLKDIEMIYLLDDKGIIRRSTDRSLLGKEDNCIYCIRALQGKESFGVELWKEKGRQVFSKAVPIFNEKSCFACHGAEKKILGILKISLDWESVLETIRSTRSRNILFSLVGLIAMSVLTILFLFKVIIFPIHKLEMGMRRVSQGDLTQELIVKSSDEIGKLTGLFNKMTQDLNRLMENEKSRIATEQQKTEELAKLNKDLTREIAERKKIEQALRGNEDYLKTIFNSVQTGVMLVDAQTHKIVDVNPVIVKAFGVEREKIIGAICHQYICPAEQGKCPITDLGQIVDNSERILLKANGERISVLKTVTPIELNNRKLLLESFTDITERKKTEKELEVLVKELKENQVLLNRQKQELDDSRRAIKNVADDFKKSNEVLEKQKGDLEKINKELDDFTYIISHDLKEPVRSIDAFSKFIITDFRDKLDEEGKFYLERIRMNTTLIQNLIEDLLEISRIEKKQNPYETVEISQVLEEVKFRFENRIKDKNVELIIHDNLPKIFCDRVRLTEVFANLVSNAIKFNDKPKPVIEIGCSEKDGFYEFYVKDNGPGIDERYFEKIFEIFQRLGHRETTEGTGAGLTIAKKIVQMHKGKIWVESKVGEGATFYFTIPIKAELIQEITTKDSLFTKEEVQKVTDKG
jgi:PAS domain S-box-containing protein